MVKSDSDRDDRGFTLVELLIVIVILGILSTVVVFAVQGLTDRGRESSCGGDRRAVETAQEANMAANSTYASEADLVASGFLKRESTLLDVTVTGTGSTSSYTTTFIGECASVGNAVAAPTTAATPTTAPPPPAVIAGFPIGATWGTGTTEYVVVGFDVGETEADSYYSYLAGTYEEPTDFTLLFLDTSGAPTSAFVDALDAQTRTVLWTVNEITGDQITDGGTYNNQDAPFAYAVTLFNTMGSMWNVNDVTAYLGNFHDPLIPL